MKKMKLLTLPPAFGVRCASPFALKAEALLAMSGLEHEVEASEPRRGPRKKMPVLLDEGAVIPDTRNIAAHLLAKYGFDPDAGLSAEDRARSHALRRMAEEHLYWAQTWFRWSEQAPVVRDAFFAPVPAPLRGLVFGMVRRQLRRDLWGHGFGRMTREEMLRLAAEDLEAIRVTLGSRPFLFGDAPTGADLTVFPLVLNLLAPGCPTALTPLAEPLRAYAERAEAAVFGPPDRSALAAVS